MTAERKAHRSPGAAKTHKPKGEPRKGSPAALLRHAGSLSDEDVEVMMKAIREADVVDWEPPVDTNT